MSKLTETVTVTQDDSEFDVVASGVAGSWSVVIDECQTNEERRFAQIKGPMVYLSFPLPTLQAIDVIHSALTISPASLIDLIPGLRAQANKPCLEITIQKDGTLPVTILRGSDDVDRCFFVVGKGSPLVRCTIAGDDLKMLGEAFRQVSEELRENRRAPSKGNGKKR